MVIADEHERLCRKERRENARKRNLPRLIDENNVKHFTLEIRVTHGVARCTDDHSAL